MTATNIYSNFGGKWDSPQVASRYSAPWLRFCCPGVLFAQTYSRSDHVCAMPISECFGDSR